MIRDGANALLTQQIAERLRIGKRRVRFVDEDPMRKTGGRATRHQSLQAGPRVRDALIRWEKREVDHDAAETMSNDGREIVGRGRRMRSTDRHDAAQLAEARVVAFRID